MQTEETVFAQRRWRLWSNDYSVYFDDENSYSNMTQQVYRVCGTGHGRCVHVFDFLDTEVALKELFSLDSSSACKERFSGRLQRCQLSDELFVSTISPWKQLVIVRD